MFCVTPEEEVIENEASGGSARCAAFSMARRHGAKKCVTSGAHEGRKRTSAARENISRKANKKKNERKASAWK